MIVENKFIMSLSLNVLNHLGINLYSNIPAVLSEIVANSWKPMRKGLILPLAKIRLLLKMTDVE